MTALREVVHTHEQHADETDGDVQRAVYEQEAIEHVGREILEGCVGREIDVVQCEAGDQTANTCGGFDGEGAYRENDTFRPLPCAVFVLISNVDQL